jgi:hypothetical protein
VVNNGALTGNLETAALRRPLQRWSSTPTSSDGDRSAQGEWGHGVLADLELLNRQIENETPRGKENAGKLASTV